MASRGSALSVLDDMFPTIPTETIATVLREHDNNVESTIEALLNVCSPAQSREKGLHVPSPVNHSPNDQIWRDEELARAMQAQLDAEASTRSAPGWLPSEGRETHAPDAGQDASWGQSGEDPFKEWRDVAASVGQTVTEGLNTFADTVSSWLSGPLDEDAEAETPRRRAEARREEGGQDSQGSVVVANDAERPLTAHRRTSSRPMDDLSIRRSFSGAALGDGEAPLGETDSKKDK